MAELDRAQTSDQPEPTISQYRALLKVSESIARHRDMSSLVRDLADRLREVVQFDGITILLHDAERGTMRLLVVESIIGPRKLPDEVPIDDSPGGWVWQTQQPMLVHDTALEARFPRMNRLIHENGVSSYCLLPLTSAGERLGTIGFASSRRSSYSQSDLKFLQSVANQVALAVNNAINFERAGVAQQQLERDHERIRLLLDINNAVVSHLALDELFHVISLSLRKVVPHDVSGIGLYDAESGQLRSHVLEYPVDLPNFARGTPIPMEGTTGGVAFTTGRPVFVDKPDFERFNSDYAMKTYEAGFRSGGSIPLIAHGRRLGVLGVASRNENAFSQDDVEMLCQVANQVAIAVENSLNYEEARAAERELARRLDHLRLLLDVTSSVTSQLDLRQLFSAISDCLRKVIKCDGIGMTIYDPETGVLRVHALDPYTPQISPLEEGAVMPIEGTPAETVLKSLQTLVLNLVDIEKFSSPLAKRIAANGVKSGCVAPLVSHGRALGTLDVVSFHDKAFTEEDATLITQIASQIAIAVENSLNFERARSAEQQMEHDRDRLKLLLGVNNAIVSHLDLRELMQVISSYLRAALQHDLIGLALYDPEINQLRAYTYNLADNQPFIEEGLPIPLEGSVTGLAFTSGKPAFMHIEDERFHSDFNRRFRDAGFKSGGCVPLIAHGRKLGILGVASFREHVFSEDEVEMFCQIANQVALAIENALAYREIEALKNKLSEEKLYLEEEINTTYDFEQIIGSSPALKRILKQVETVAPTDSTVLIQGETGTGKEVIARAIHSLSARRERTLVKINCAAIPMGLIESELFGHERGAFTGAIAQRIGRFELANKGTLFLDEVGEIPQELQSKLLRVLQEREFERLGSTRTVRVDVRLIAATNRDLYQMVGERRFRDDLYYRLNVFPITIPPLRERREDIPLLVSFFASKFARHMKKRIETISADAVAAMQQYNWPGNIRELENFIERAVILTQGTDLQIPFSEMKLPLKAASSPGAPIQATPSKEGPELTSLESVERDHILRVLNETDWVVSGPNGAAARLGLKRTTLQARMKKLGISRHRAAP